MEKKITGYVLRWLGLLKSLSNRALYGVSNALQLSFRALVQELKVVKTREAILYQDSKVPKVTKGGIEV